MGIEERKEREKNKRKESILDAAIQVYLEQGYHGTTMEKIAKEAELSRATLYLYFKTKDEIFVSAIVAFAEYFGGLLEDLYGKKDTLENGLLKELWRVFEKYYWKDPTRFNLSLYFHQSEMVRGLTDELRRLLDRTGSMIYSKLCLIVEYGINMGYFNRCNHKTLAEVIWTSFLGVVHLENSKKAMHRKNHFGITFDLAYSVISKGILTEGVKVT